MNTVIYPTVDLFIYQLRQGLGDDKDNVLKNKESFLEYFNLEPQVKAFVEKAITDQNYINKSSYFVPLLQSSNYQKLTNNPEDKYKLEGFYYPVISADTYGLLFDCSIIPSEQEQPINCFEYLKKLAPQENNNLGKVWILSTHSPPQSDSRTLAKSIYEHFRKNEPEITDQNIQWEWKYHQHLPESKFLGADIFWIDHFYPLEKYKNQTEEQGILIIVYPEALPNPDVQKIAANLNKHWLNLFSFQCKIIWAYKQAQDIREQLETEFIEIRNTFLEIKNLPLEESNPNLDIHNLQSILKKRVKNISSYAINLSYLEIQLSTIETNLHNYKLCLEHIENQANKHHPTKKTSLDCFRKNFVEVVESQYKKQVEKDREILTPGLTTLENLINQLKNITELEEGERDRHIENIIAATGIGVGTASAAASSIANFVPLIRQSSTDKTTSPESLAHSAILNFGFAFGVSIIIGVGFTFIALLIIPWVRSLPFHWNKIQKKISRY